MSKTMKAGCILMDIKNKKIGLVYRDYLHDYSFPKGHLEEGETLVECAVRETAEETKRDVSVLIDEPICLEEYTTPSGEKVLMHYYLVKDIGHSDNDSTDTHELIWVPYDRVYDMLTYPSLKEVWNNVKGKVKEYFDNGGIL